MNEPDTLNAGPELSSLDGRPRAAPAASGIRRRFGALEFKALAETIPGLVFVTDQAGTGIYTNVQFARFAGLTVDALSRNSWLSVLHPDDKDQARARWVDSLSAGTSHDARYRLRRFDGDYRWHVVRGSPLVNAQGEIVRWMGVCTDVDDLVSSITTNTNSQAVLNALGKGSGLILYAKDAQGRFVYANEATVEVIGEPVEHIIGRSAEELAPGSEQAAAIRRHDALAQISDEGITVEESWPGQDGEMRYFRSRKARLRLSNGGEGLAAATVEITTEKALEQAVRRSRARYQAWLDAIPLASFETDCAGNIISVNQHWLDTCGLPMRDADHLMSDLVISEAQEGFAAAWSASLKNLQPLDINVPIYDHFDRKVRTSRFLAFPGFMLGALDVEHWYGSFS